MKEYTTENLRNIALASHSGAGKTTLAERLLFDTKVLTRMGNVQSGTTAMDFEEEEIERTASINTAIAPVEWKGTKLNLLDTPGYIDFVGEVLAALKVADAAVILVEAVAGVEVGTEMVWQYAEERGLPRFLLVNKMDRENARRLMDSEHPARQPDSPSYPWPGPERFGRIQAEGLPGAGGQRSGDSTTATKPKKRAWPWWKRSRGQRR